MPHKLVTEITDSHVHVVGPADAYPQADGRRYTAGPATVEDLKRVGEPAGVGRYVLVQPSFYGTDNSFLLESLDLLQGQGRGVVVLASESISPSQLEALKHRGVRGVRINLYSKLRVVGSGGFEDVLKRYVDKIPRESWHIEVIATLDTLTACAQAIADSPIPIVIDHYGLPGDEGPEGLYGRSLLELLTVPHVWMKVSAPYRVLSDPVATHPPADWLAACLLAAPDRCLWGSDWPHTPELHAQTGSGMSVPYRSLDYPSVLGDFVRALPSSDVAESVLRLNPARLYEFNSAKASGT